jgi:hypothetical protein
MVKTSVGRDPAAKVTYLIIFNLILRRDSLTYRHSGPCFLLLEGSIATQKARTLPNLSWPAILLPDVLNVLTTKVSVQAFLGRE